MRPFAPHRRARGLTLVELLVAVGVGALMLAGAVRIFISNKDAYAYNVALANIQATGRISMDLMLHDLRHAGHFGCSDSLDNVINASYSSSDVTNGTVQRGALEFMGIPRDRAGAAAEGQWVAMALEGFDEADGTAVPSWSPNSAFTWAPTTADGRALIPLEDSDGFTVRYIQPTAGYRTMADGGTTDEVVISFADKPANADAGVAELAERGIFDGAMVGVVHCRRAHIFEVDDVEVDTAGTVATATLTSTEEFEQAFSYATDNSAIVGRYVAVRYFVAGGRLDPARPANDTTTRIPTLYRERLVRDAANSGLEAVAEPVVEGVEDLQVLYGFDNQEDAAGVVQINDGEPDSYLTADAVGSYTHADADAGEYPWVNWMNVLVVRVAVLVRSPERIQRDPQLSGTELTAEKTRQAGQFKTLARFRDPSDSSPDDVEFTCGGSNPADACRYSRRLLVGTASVRNL